MAMETVDINEIAARLKRLQSEALVRMMSPATKHDSRVYYDGEATAYGNALTLIRGRTRNDFRRKEKSL